MSGKAVDRFLTDKTEGRDEKGRFAKGNRGGPGRPPFPVERTYLLTLAKSCPPETWRQIVDRAVKDALEGDHKAREWLSRYLLPASLDPAVSRLTEAHVGDVLEIDDVSEYMLAQVRDGTISLKKIDALIEKYDVAKSDEGEGIVLRCLQGISKD